MTGETIKKLEAYGWRRGYELLTERVSGAMEELLHRHEVSDVKGMFETLCEASPSLRASAVSLAEDQMTLALDQCITAEVVKDFQWDAVEDSENTDRPSTSPNACLRNCRLTITIFSLSDY
ncbi:MAG: hypothetical protein RBT53_02410 [Azonexus sp.]|nr:hypothetical protein [Azonexus sp.]